MTHKQNVLEQYVDGFLVIGLLAGLVAACCLGQETLALIKVSGVMLIALAIVGALLGAGAVYVVDKCIDKIKVTNMQRERRC